MFRKYSFPNIRSLAILVFFSVLTWSIAWPNSEKTVTSTDPQRCELDFKSIASIPYPECLAEQLTSFSDWSMGENDGDVIVYLTNLSDVDEARKLIEPFYKKFRSQRFMGRGELLFEKSDYNYGQLREWQLRLVDDLQMPNADVVSVTLFFGRVSIFVKYDSTIEQVKQYLTSQSYPLNGFRISSREAEIKSIASIAPDLKIRDDKTLLALPAVLWNNDIAGQLILGETSMKEVGSMLPAWPGHGPKKIKTSDRKFPPWTKSEVKSVLDNMKYSYNPRMTFIITGFNKNRLLIFSGYTVQEGQGEPLKTNQSHPPTPRHAI